MEKKAATKVLNEDRGLVLRARDFAIKAHSRINHRRKYSNEPYDVHLKDVADIIKTVTDDQELIAAAWLHDIVEDTPATFLELEQKFGPAIAQLVAEVTDVSSPGNGNRATRKAIDRAHLARASVRGKTIKLADLIDNCRDICNHDPAFAKVYLTEMSGLLEVLQEGHPKLLARATSLMQESAAVLKLPLDVITTFQEIPAKAPRSKLFVHDRVSDVFFKTFVAKDIAQFLPSIDAPTPQVVSLMDEYNISAIGIRREGLVAGFVTREEPLRVHDFRGDQLVDENAGFAAVILALTRHNMCFVKILGQVTGIIARDDIQHTFVRMWLFGIITMLEMQSTPLIEQLWPDGDWVKLVPEKRLAKANDLLIERQRRNQHPTLLDCLQFSDKMQILIENQEILDDLGFLSKRVAKKVCKDLESLRNNLAHAQDIVTHDFTQIARMAQRIETEYH